MSEQLLAEVSSVVALALGFKAVDAKDSFVGDLGVEDEVDYGRISLGIAGRFSVRVTIEQLRRLRTVGDLAVCVSANADVEEARLLPVDAPARSAVPRRSW